MIIVILFSFLVELAKWLLATAILVVIIKFSVAFLFKKKVNFLYLIFPVFLISSSAPFAYWKYRFVIYDKKFVEACEAETYVKILGGPPKDMVAFHSSDPNKYIRRGSSRISNISEMKRYNLNSLVIYEKSEKTSMDDIADRWKKLTLADQGDPNCKFFNNFVNKTSKYSRLLRRDLPNQCLVVEVLDTIDNVNFIDTVKTIDVVYSDDSFGISRHRTKIVNSRTDEEFIDIQQVMAGFPRFPHNFYAGFLNWAKPCVKANQLRDNKVQGPSAKSIIFNEKRVKQLKEKGYGI